MSKIKQFLSAEGVKFIGKTCFYFIIIIFLIYLYHYRSIQGGTFIYNEF